MTIEATPGAGDSSKTESHHILFATAEYAPVAMVGGLGVASAGLVGALREQGHSVEVVMPGYSTRPPGPILSSIRLDVPAWAGPVTAVRVNSPTVGPLTVVRAAVLERPHPYTDATGLGWLDNDYRFMVFSAAVAALAKLSGPDVVHLNDWHTAAAAAWIDPAMPLVLSIHNAAFQGWCSKSWLARLGPAARAFDRGHETNLLAGAVALADRVVAVSPTYAEEMTRAETGVGLDEALRGRGSAFLGIRNGIDTDIWNAAQDPVLNASFTADDLSGKRQCRREVLSLAGLADKSGPVIGFVGRFVEQKGVDLALGLAPFLEGLPARLILMGRGDAQLELQARNAATAYPDSVAYLDSSHPAIARRLIAGSDILAVPSRFEPCGLTQMEALTYGALPLVTPVGGLVDTVVDADLEPDEGNGFVAATVDGLGFLDAVHRACRAWRDPHRIAELRARAMTADWSWFGPAQDYADLYTDLLSSSRTPVVVATPELTTSSVTAIGVQQAAARSSNAVTTTTVTSPVTPATSSPLLPAASVKPIAVSP